MQSHLSRREFLELTAASLGAVSLACSGFSVLDAHASEAPQCLLPKGTDVNKNILIAYASRCGSTTEVAQAIAQDFTNRGFKADVRSAESVTSVSAYGAVVVASAVRFGRWLPPAVAFARGHQSELKSIPLAFLTVHLMNTGTDEKSRAARESYTNEARALVQPCVEVFFAGKMDTSKLSFSERMLGKVMGAKNTDQRNWPAIHAWARGVFNS